MANGLMELVDSIGIEFEFSDIIRNNRGFQAAVANRIPGFHINHDASCETPVKTLAGYKIKSISPEAHEVLAKYIRPDVCGGELVSPVHNACSDIWKQAVINLCSIMAEYGETEASERDSLHIHINVSRDIPLYAMKNLLKFTLGYEAIIFRLGGMGRKNRGEKNDYTYERPFLGAGPPVILDIDPTGGPNQYYPCIDPDDLLLAESKLDFFNRYGNAYILSQGRNRYVTCRYMVVNFYPILTQGSFEFRAANKTLNPYYIIAWADFCRAIVQQSFAGRDESFTPAVRRPLYDNREISEREFLESLTLLPSLDITSKNILLEIWRTSPTPYFDNIWRFSHLQNPTRFGVQHYRPKPLPPNIIKHPRFVDLHVLNGERLINEPPPPPELPEEILRVEVPSLYDFIDHDTGEIHLENLRPRVDYMQDDPPYNFLVYLREGVVFFDVDREYEDAGRVAIRWETVPVAVPWMRVFEQINLRLEDAREELLAEIAAEENGELDNPNIPFDLNEEQ